MTLTVLLVDDDRPLRDALAQTLDLAGFPVIQAGTYIEAKDHVREDFPGIVVSDIRMPGKDGFDLLGLVRKTDPELPVILLTGEGDVPMAVRGMSSGAFDFLEKPCDIDEFLTVVRKAAQTRSLVLENRALKREIRRGDAAARMLVGTSALSEQMREAARAAARTSAEVLVTGPKGAGTAKMAEVIHLLSAAAQRPLIKVPGVAMTPETVEDAFRRAEGGTIFVDEVSALSPAAQYHLLDRLESVAGTRVIAGTYADLTALANAGTFNADLYYRLDVMRVRIPALKERPEDIPVLFRHYVAIACEQAHLPEPDITPDVISGLMAQDWPGNARALMNAAMRFAMRLSDPVVQPGELGLNEQIAQVEATLITDALRRCGGNATEAAAALKLPRKTFYDKLARHGIRPEDYRG